MLHEHVLCCVFQQNLTLEPLLCRVVFGSAVCLFTVRDVRT